LQRAAQQAPAALDDVLLIEARDFREVARFGDHQLADRRQWRLPDVLPPAEEQLAQQIGSRSVMLGQTRLGGRQRGAHAVFDHRLEERFLAVEIEVERTLRSAGARRDVVKSRAGKALLGEKGERRGGEFAGARFLAPAARRSTSACRHRHRKRFGKQGRRRIG